MLAPCLTAGRSPDYISSTCEQANCADDGMRAMCERDGIRGLPYFRFHASGRVLGEFPANLHKVGRLREEIAAMKMRVAGS